MKRKIKFKAWDKKNKQFLDPRKWAKELRIHLSGGISVDSNLAEKENVSVFEIEIQQFTDFYDKNGKEIYCSDFVGVSKEKYGEVYWNEDELAWWVEPIGTYPCEPLRGKGKAVEILGNKYEGLA